MDTLQKAQLHKVGETLCKIAYEKSSPASTRGAFLDLSPRDLEKYSLVRAMDGMCKAIASNKYVFDGLEGEAHAALLGRLDGPPKPARLLIPSDVLAYCSQRDATVASASNGGYLVGTHNLSFIDMLRNRAVTSRLGVQRLHGLRENITFPVGSGSATITWLSTESTQATESGPTVTQTSGMPKTVAAYTEISRQLLLQSTPAADSTVKFILSADVAVAEDAAVLQGAGSNGEPHGIVGTSGTGTFAVGASMSYTGLMNAQKDVADANAVVMPEACGYVTTPAVAEIVKGRQRFTGTDSPLWRGSLHDGEIEGVRAVSTKNCPADTMIYGDWSQIVVAEWGVLALELNPFANFQMGLVGVRAMWSVDVIVLHPPSFTIAESVS